MVNIIDPYVDKCGLLTGLIIHVEHNQIQLRGVLILQLVFKHHQLVFLNLIWVFRTQVRLPEVVFGRHGILLLYNILDL